MFSFAITFRSLLVLAVLAATGPWCCCSAATLAHPSGDRSMTEEHGCCPTDEKTPAHAPHKGDRCDKGCDVIASVPDAAVSAIATATDHGCDLIDAAAVPSSFIVAFNTPTLLDTGQPPGPFAPVLRSLYAQNCLLTI